MFTVTFEETTDVFDRVVVPLFTVNVLRSPVTPRVPLEIVAPITLPETVAFPSRPVTVRSPPTRPVTFN